jgi:hypothetical protein
MWRWLINPLVLSILVLDAASILVIVRRVFS